MRLAKGGIARISTRNKQQISLPIYTGMMVNVIGAFSFLQVLSESGGWLGASWVKQERRKTWWFIRPIAELSDDVPVGARISSCSPEQSKSFASWQSRVVEYSPHHQSQRYQIVRNHVYVLGRERVEDCPPNNRSTMEYQVVYLFLLSDCTLSLPTTTNRAGLSSSFAFHLTSHGDFLWG
jgi:hypothetical protein